MDPVTRLYGRISLLYLALGFVLGGILMAGPLFGANWNYAWSATHGHIMFVGWFVQFAIGIAFWLLPRRKTATNQWGYNVRLVYIASGLVNSGLVLRILLEPLYRAGVLEGTPVQVGLTISGALQASAALIWVSQLWGRFFRRFSTEKGRQLH
jgi:hypothetical protein